MRVVFFFSPPRTIFNSGNGKMCRTDNTIMGQWMIEGMWISPYVCMRVCVWARAMDGRDKVSKCYRNLFKIFNLVFCAPEYIHIGFKGEEKEEAVEEKVSVGVSCIGSFWIMAHLPPPTAPFIWSISFGFIMIFFFKKALIFLYGCWSKEKKLEIGTESCRVVWSYIIFWYVRVCMRV